MSGTRLRTAALTLTLALGAAAPSAAQTNDEIVAAGNAQGDAPPDNATPAWTAADQEDADAGAAMRAAMEKNNPQQASAPANETYGPPLPPGYQAAAAKAGLDKVSSDDPAGLGGSADGTGWFEQQGRQDLLALNTGRTGTPPTTAAAPARPTGRSLATSSRGNGGLQSQVPAAVPGAGVIGGPGGSATASTSGDDKGTKGPAERSAPQGAILDVANAEQMGQTIATFAGLTRAEEKQRLRQQALLAPTRTGARAPSLASPGVPAATGADPWRNRFDGAQDVDTAVPVKATFRGVPLRPEDSVKGA